jgi:hypothetical protein
VDPAEFRDKPLKLAAVLWPHVTFYREQKAIIESVWANDETFVPAGNKLGKDFVAGKPIAAGVLGVRTGASATTLVSRAGCAAGPQR